MRLFIEKDYKAMSSKTAGLIIETVRKKPDALLCLAAGDTPKLAYTMIAGIAARENIDLGRCQFVSLDEWVGISPENEGSCQYFLRTTLFGPLKTDEKNIHLFDALSNDLDKECILMDDFIRNRGGIDLMVVGIGRNGHIGFNEPGVPFEKYSHVVELDETTRLVGQKYFRESTPLTRGITLGLQYLLESGTPVLIANGINKAEVIRKALEDKVSTVLPASIIQRHPDAVVVVDEEAASLMQHL